MSRSAFDQFFQRIKETIGIHSQTELAAVLQVNRSAITQAKQRGTVPESWIFKLTRTFDLAPEWLETGHGEKREESDFIQHFRQIPKVRARLSAGGGSFEINGDVEGYYAFRREWLQKKGNPKQMVLMDVVGDSMEPAILEHDTVLIDQSQQELIAGRIYALGIEDTVMIKRIEKHPGKLVLISSNPHYSPIFVQGEELETVRIIGALVWIGREL
jgi:phage repressor protein C with HTH and peptisase S24 domain